MDFHCFTVENPKRELDFKMSVTAGLQDVNSMYMTQKKNIMFSFLTLIDFIIERLAMRNLRNK